MRPFPPQKAAPPDAHPGNDPPCRPPKLVNPEGAHFLVGENSKGAEGILLAKAQRRRGVRFAPWRAMLWCQFIIPPKVV